MPFTLCGSFSDPSLSNAEQHNKWFVFESVSKRIASIEPADAFFHGSHRWMPTLLYNPQKNKYKVEFRHDCNCENVLINVQFKTCVLNYKTGLLSPIKVWNQLKEKPRNFSWQLPGFPVGIIGVQMEVSTIFQEMGQIGRQPLYEPYSRRISPSISCSQFESLGSSYNYDYVVSMKENSQSRIKLARMDWIQWQHFEADTVVHNVEIQTPINQHITTARSWIVDFTDKKQSNKRLFIESGEHFRFDKVGHGRFYPFSTVREGKEAFAFLDLFYSKLISKHGYAAPPPLASTEDSAGPDFAPTAPLASIDPPAYPTDPTEKDSSNTTSAPLSTSQTDSITGKHLNAPDHIDDPAQTSQIASAPPSYSTASLQSNLPSVNPSLKSPIPSNSALSKAIQQVFLNKTVVPPNNAPLLKQLEESTLFGDYQIEDLLLSKCPSEIGWPLKDMVIVGSAARSTQVDSNQNVDIVIFFNQLVPQETWSLNHPQDVLERVCNFAKLLVNNFVHSVVPSAQLIQVSMTHLEYLVATPPGKPLQSIDVFLSWSHLYQNPKRVYQMILKNAQLSQFVDPALYPLQADFCQNLSSNSKSLVRTIKSYRNETIWFSGDRPNSYLIELLVHYAFQLSHPGYPNTLGHKGDICKDELDIKVIFDTLFSLIIDEKSMSVVWNDHYNLSAIPQSILQTRPLILDPVNPCNNVANSIKNWAPFRKLIAKLLRMF